MTALGFFFAAGSLVSLTSCVSILLPGSLLEPMWRLNPRAREAFAGREGWAALLLGAVCVACSLAAVGLWRCARSGYWVAVSLLAVNLAGDLTNVLLRTEPRAVWGIPVAVAMLAYLSSRRVRTVFRD